MDDWIHFINFYFFFNVLTLSGNLIHFLLIVIILMVGSLFYFLSKKASPKINNFIKRTSKNVTSIYLIQWVLILFLTYINQFVDVESNIILRIITFLAVIVLSLLMAEAYEKIISYISRYWVLVGIIQLKIRVFILEYNLIKKKWKMEIIFVCCR